MKRTLFAIILLFSILAQSVSAQEEQNRRQESAAGATPENTDVSIAFYNRTIYYPGAADDNPVYVHVTVTNTGSSTMHFKVADDRMFSIDFRAFTVKNTQLEETEKLMRKRTTNQTVYFRNISLEPGESYSFVENLKDFLEVKEPSVYYIELDFYPELLRNQTNHLNSNRLTLEVRPSPAAAASSTIAVQADTAAVLQTETISPDKVVEQTIIARQKSLWDQYFLYMDLEEMLKRDSARKRRYNRVSADEREEMLRAFRADLMQNRIDFDIVAIPFEFEIDTTTYSQTEGTVTVIEKFRNNTFVEKKKYTYYVRQRDGIWQIYDYTVDNLGTE